MIGSLLDKIGGLFEKDFLFASFLPAIVFVSALVMTFAVVLGFDEAWSWVEWLSAREQAFASFGAGVGLLVFSYILAGLRPVFTRIWCGKSHNFIYRPFVALGEQYWRARYRRLRFAAETPGIWAKIDDNFRSRIAAALQSRSPSSPAPSNVVLQLASKAAELAVFPNPAGANAMVDSFVAEQARYSEDSLGAAFQAIAEVLNLARSCDTLVRKGARAAVVNEFGPQESVRATGLGNLFEAFQHYPAGRYNMESEIYWPRLRRVVPQEYLSVVDEPRIVMDFSITMATLMAWYALLTAFIGPWLWMNWRLWLGTTVLGAMGSVFFYRRAVTAASQYAQLNNSCFDLFRLDLLAGLHFPLPSTLQEERGFWSGMSQLIVFGATSNADMKLYVPPAPAANSA
jgi:hypothetical protein